MSRILTTLTFFLLAFGSYAQSSHFFTDGSRWVYSNYESFEPGQAFLYSSTEQDIIHGDTIINGESYFKLYSTFYNVKTVFLPNMPPQLYYSYDSVGPTFVRYDTIQKRIYHLPTVVDSERLIYDFNLQVGDTVPLQSVVFPMMTIGSIDTVMIWGRPVKRFFLDIGIAPQSKDNVILEGIGGSNGLIHAQPEALVVSGGIQMTHFNCFQSKDSIYSPENNDCPFISFVSGVSSVEEAQFLAIRPNPSTDVFTLQVAEEFISATLSVYDNLGRSVQTVLLTAPSMTIQVPGPGLYWWQLKQNGRVLKTGKIIKT